MKVPFFRVDLSEEEISEVVDSLKSGWLTTGPKTKKFEEKFAEYTGAEYAIALNSCTAALHLSLEAISIQPGDMILVPTMTFAATAEVIQYHQAVPVFIDCDETLCLDPEKLSSTITKILNDDPVAGLKPPYGKLRAVFPMHYGGYCCDMKKISEICSKHQIEIIEDAAHALPSRYRPSTNSNWNHAGRFGRTGCFSFYANKCITTGEGGMVITDDKDIADRIRLMSLHGMNNDAWKRYSGSGSWYYEIVAPGYKYNLTDIASALGFRQLERVEELYQQRKRVADQFNFGFAEVPEIITPVADDELHQHAWHLYSIRLDLEKLTIDRAEFINKMVTREVQCSVHWQPLHMMPFYREKFGYKPELFPVSNSIWPQLVSLPIFPSMKDDEINYVIESVIKIVEENKV